MSGPLTGLTIVEMAGLGPAPFCGMVLSDMGAEVVRIDQKRKPGAPASPYYGDVRFDILARGRRSLALDLKQPRGVELALALIARSDVVIEGFRPGVMERLGLGPEVCLARQPKLVYGRVTGWGQTGPLSQAAGHDLNYIALTGALYGMGRADAPPTVPLNLVGDFGGGAMMLAFGVVCGLLEAQRSGKGQVIDAAMTDGTTLLTSMMLAFLASGGWSPRRGDNLLDGGAPFYDTYVCADGKFVSIGALEPHFFALLMGKLGLEVGSQYDRSAWPALRGKLTALFASQARQHWCDLLEGTDACFAPVLDWSEAATHPHNVARETFIEVDGVRQPAPAPRFDRTPGAVSRGSAAAGAHSDEVLRELGLADEDVSALRDAGII
ncbi:MAG: CaiB/BaiF CoA-transferase family protein [Polyangia bacterium]